MKIKRFIGGSLESNGYILYKEKPGTCYIIDPGYSPKRFIDFLNENQLTLSGILLTHLHHDHTGGADAIKGACGGQIYMHADDAYIYKGQVDMMLEDGDCFDLAGTQIKTLHTPGHTQGSVCFFAERERICFTGDTIFDTDLGRTDLAGGSEKAMKNSICTVVDQWENDIIIYPGHDEAASMKNVRKYNKEFLALRDGYER